MQKRRINLHIKPFLVVVSVLLILFTVAFFRARPMIRTVARHHTDNVLSDAVNYGISSALETGQYTYKDLAVISRAEDGAFLGLEINTVRLNALKLDIADGISQYLKKHGNDRFSLPVGNLLLSEYTNGLGPRIRLPIEISAISCVTYDNRFEAVGINQSCHKIYMNIQFRPCVMTIGSTDEFSVSISVPVAQTVIVGKVPNSYMSIADKADTYLAKDLQSFSDEGD